jgi:hypothetical protein
MTQTVFLKLTPSLVMTLEHLIFVFVSGFEFQISNFSCPAWQLKAKIY